MLDKREETILEKNIVVIIKLFLLFISFRATVTEEEIKEAFTASTFEVKAFKFFP